MDKEIKLDGGTLEERIKEMKEFCGLRPDQSFQDIEIFDEDDNEVKKMVKPLHHLMRSESLNLSGCFYFPQRFI